MRCEFLFNRETRMMQVSVSAPVVEALWQEVGSLGGFNPGVWLHGPEVRVEGGSDRDRDIIGMDLAETLQQDFATQAEVAKAALESSENEHGLVVMHFTAAQFRAFTLWLGHLSVAREEVPVDEIGIAPGLFGDEDLADLLDDESSSGFEDRASWHSEPLDPQEVTGLLPTLVSFIFLRVMVTNMLPQP